MFLLLDLIDKISTDLKRSKFDLQELQNILFLIDWRSTLSSREPVSGLTWEIGQDGPYSKGFFDFLLSNKNKHFISDNETLTIGISDNPNPSKNTLTHDQLKIVEFTLSRVSTLDKITLSTLIKTIFPMKLEKYTPLNLKKIGGEYLESGVKIQEINFNFDDK